jgi:hypothetical protein
VDGPASRRKFVFGIVFLGESRWPPQIVIRYTAMSELIVPPIAATDPNAVEMARVWHSGGKQHVSLNAPGWKDPAAWGLLLVDIAEHVADAYAQAEGRDRQEVLARIKAGFDAEWKTATDKPKGGFFRR